MDCGWVQSWPQSKESTLAMSSLLCVLVHFETTINLTGISYCQKSKLHVWFTALFLTVAYCELTNIDTRDLDVVEISLVTLVAGR